MSDWAGSYLTFPAELNRKDKKLMLLSRVLCASDICAECRQMIMREYVRLSQMSWSKPKLQLTDEHVHALQMQADFQDGWGGARDEALVNEYLGIFDESRDSESQDRSLTALSDSVIHMFINNGLWTRNADEWAFKVSYACEGPFYTLRDLALGRDYTSFTLMHHERVLFAMNPHLGEKCTCVGGGALYLEKKAADGTSASSGPHKGKVSETIYLETLPEYTSPTVMKIYKEVCPRDDRGNFTSNLADLWSDSVAFRAKLNILRNHIRVRYGWGPEDSTLADSPADSPGNSADNFVDDSSSDDSSSDDSDRGASLVSLHLYEG
ncbi:hypothetical protein B0H67DRAFT_648643 [Lasiosphaeris hirsuta]|uniref:Uncharacterized protein n=1 Tax=Lasiosphaeris hirsuta TaxID=260670 RepID=A0AA40A3H8_9PEZI|nr:hypothetical protein B0H67DRAFT_648643 [Lasiosphaeris hirsuta]